MLGECDMRMMLIRNRYTTQPEHAEKCKFISTYIVNKYVHAKMMLCMVYNYINKRGKPYVCGTGLSLVAIVAATDDC